MRKIKYNDIEFEDYVDELGNIFSRKMKPRRQKANKEYNSIALYLDGKRYDLMVHRVVASTYLGYKEGMQVDHIDGDKKNNRVDNLEWVTASENTKRAYDKGLSSRQKPVVFGKQVEYIKT